MMLAGAAGVAKVAPSATPPAAKGSSSSSEAARSSSVAPASGSFWRAAASELGAVRGANPSPASLSAMVRLPPLPPSSALGLVPGLSTQSIGSSGSRPALPPSVMSKLQVSVDGGLRGLSGKENEGRWLGGAKRVRLGAEDGLEGRKEGEESAASALMKMNGW